MEIFSSRELKNFGAITTLGAVLLSGCGGEAKPRVEGEFADNLRVQRFRPSDSARLYTEIIQQCDASALVETTMDIGLRAQDGKRRHHVDIEIKTYPRHRFCEDGVLTPDDFTHPPALTNDGSTA